MRFGSVCSGIEAASVAWESLGFTPVFHSEIDPAPSKVLAHHYPNVPNLGDFTTIGSEHKLDILIGGTPCQSFSVSGNRLGLDDDRGNLALQFCRLAGRLLPRWVIWENVAGALSTDRGRAFGSIVGALADLGYGWAYRVLDAGFFGSPHRRRRVFLVGHLGDWRGAGAVLFDGQGCFRNPPKSGAERYSSCYAPEERARIFVEGKEGLPYLTASNAAKGINNQTPIIFHTKQDPISLTGHSISQNASMQGPGVLKDGVLRRFTPLEVERLFGFPDNWTAPIGADSPRYKALGNSMDVNVIRWLGKRIQDVTNCQAH